MKRTALVVAVLLIAVDLARAEPPVLTSLSRRGVQRGTTSVIAVTGANLSADVQLLLPAEVKIDKYEVRKQPAPTATRIDIELTPAVSVRPGLYPLRLANADGVSGMMLLEIGDLPEREEIEPNNAFEQATDLASLPAVVTGAMAGQDIDTFKFRLSRGQRVTVEVAAQRIGSNVLPVLELYTAGRQLIAAGESTALTGADARLSLTAPADGEYFIQLHDLLYRGGNPGQYRLKIGDYTYADAVFPLGGRRGESVPVEFVGGNLTAPVRSIVELKGLPAHVDRIAVRLPDTVSVGAPQHVLLVDDLAEFTQGADGKAPTATAPCALNGRLRGPQPDRWTVKVTPGRRRFEVHAAGLGSPVMPVLELYNPAGQRLAVAPDRADSFDPVLDFDVPANLPEVVVAVGDLHRRSGPAHVYRVVVRPTAAPDFSLTVDNDVLNIPAGGTALVRVKAARAGYTGPIKLSVPDLPAGVTVGGANLPDNQVDALLTFTAGKTVRAPSTTLTIVGEGTTKDGPIRRVARRSANLAPEGGPMVSPYVGHDVFGTVGKPGLIAIRATPAYPDLSPGVPFTINIEIDRDPAGLAPHPQPAAEPKPAAKTEAKAPAKVDEKAQTDANADPKAKTDPKAKAKVDTKAAPPPPPAGPGDGPVNLAVVHNLLGPNPQNQQQIQQIVIAAAPPAQQIKAGAIQGTLTLNVDVKAPLRTVDLVVQATLLNKANQPAATVFSQPISAKIVPPFRLETAAPKFTGKAGGKVAVKGKVVREGPFNNPVTVKAAGLPAGYTATTSTAAAGATDFTVEVAVPANAKPGEFPFNLTGTWQVTPQVPYTPGPTPVTLVIEPGVAPPTKDQPKTMPTPPPAGPPVVEIFEDDAAKFLAQLSKGENENGTGFARSKASDKYSGTASLLVQPLQRYNELIEGWNFPIVEKPGPGQYRYLRFAWKKAGGTGIMIQLADNGKWPPEQGRPLRRYFAGAGKPMWAAVKVADEAPGEWVVVTRDLFKDFGAFTLTGIALTAVDGEHGYFDHIYLGRSIEELDKVEKK